MRSNCAFPPHSSLLTRPHRETTLELDYYPNPEVLNVLFSGSGPEDPRRWNRYLSVGWLGTDTVQVAYGPEISFLSRVDSLRRLRIVYTPRVRGSS